MTNREARFQRLYRSNYEPIVGYAARRTASLEDAFDVTAETFLAAWRRLDDLPADDNARLWLYGTARKVLANHHRGHRRARALTQRLAEHQTTSDAADHDTPTAEVDALAAAFIELSATDQDLLLLASWEGLSPAQIATVLDCSRPAALVRLHRARRRFEARLERHGMPTASSRRPPNRTASRASSRDGGSQ